MVRIVIAFIDELSFAILNAMSTLAALSCCVTMLKTFVITSALKPWILGELEDSRSSSPYPSAPCN